MSGLVSVGVVVAIIAQAAAVSLPALSADLRYEDEAEVATEIPFCANYAHELGVSVVPKYARAKTQARFNVLLEMERLKLKR